MSAHPKKHCADCGLSQALHRREGQHPAVLALPDGYQCERFVSPSDAAEIRRGLREQLNEVVAK